MESILDYFDYYEPFPQIICVVGFMALLVMQRSSLFFPVKKDYKEKSTSKPKLTFVASIVLIACHLIYFQYQHNTPHYLYYDHYDGRGRVDISEIVSVETDKSGVRTYFIFQLANGTKLEWVAGFIYIRSKSHRKLRGIDLLDITDYK